MRYYERPDWLNCTSKTLIFYKSTRLQFLSVFQTTMCSYRISPLTTRTPYQGTLDVRRNATLGKFQRNTILQYLLQKLTRFLDWVIILWDLWFFNMPTVSVRKAEGSSNLGRLQGTFSHLMWKLFFPYRILEKKPTTNAFLRTTTAVTQFNAGVKVCVKIILNNVNVLMFWNRGRGSCVKFLSVLAA